MRNYLNTPNEEFCRNLWLSNPSPDVARLLNMVDELIQWEDMGETPEDVLKTIASAEREVVIADDMIAELREEIAQLEKRTIEDMVKDLRMELHRAENKARTATYSAEVANDRAADAKHRLDTWAILNR
jgi:hypothetical protein